MSFSRMDIPKQVISMGLDFAKTILDNGEIINATVVVMTEDMGELELMIHSALI